MSLRPEAEDGADAEFLFALFTSTQEAALALAPLDDAGKRFLLRMQFNSMNDTYRQQFPNARFEVVTLDAAPIGRLITDLRADHIYYVDIALLPERRGGGLATALMTSVLEEARKLGVPARVNVLHTNAASLRLCHRLGFKLRANRSPYLELEWLADHRTVPP